MSVYNYAALRYNVAEEVDRADALRAIDNGTIEPDELAALARVALEELNAIAERDEAEEKQLDLYAQEIENLRDTIRETEDERDEARKKYEELAEAVESRLTQWGDAIKSFATVWTKTRLCWIN